MSVRRPTRSHSAVDSPSGELDLAVQRTLEALSATGPAPGFHERILRGIERTEAQSAAVPRSLRPALSFGWRTAAALLLLLVAFAGWRQVARRRAPIQPTPSLSAGAKPRQASPSEITLPATSAGETPSSAPTPRLAVESTFPSAPIRLSVTNRARVMPAANEPAALAPTATRSAEEAAMEDWHTPSFPAPAMPLTAQERMVRLMLRRGEKHDLAALDSAAELRFAQRERAAMKDFFDPPPPPAPDLSLPPEGGGAAAPTGAAPSPGSAPPPLPSAPKP